MAQVKAQLEESKARLAQQIKNVVDGINSAYLAAAGKEKELRVQMDKQKSETFALKDASVQYAILAREANTNKQLYDSVQERFREISVAGELPSSNVTIVDRAEIPRLPAKPNKRLNLMLGALSGTVRRLRVGAALGTFGQHFEHAGRGRALSVACLVSPSCLTFLPCRQVRRIQLRRWFAGSHRGTPRYACRARNLESNDQRHLMISEVYHKLRMDDFISPI